MVSIGGRLREERNRLGVSQTEFAAVGKVTKKTQGLYEKGDRSPTADYLSALNDFGVDVLYVIAGNRLVSGAVRDDESDLLDVYRHIDNDEVKKNLLHLVLFLSAQSGLIKEYRDKVVHGYPFSEKEKSLSIAEMVAENSPDVDMLKGVIERVERILVDEQMKLSPEQKARVIVACIHVSQKEGVDLASAHISTAIRAVI